MPQPAHVETPLTSSEEIRDKTMLLKRSTIYSPPNHTNGTTPTTRAEVEEAEAAEHR